MVYSTRLFVLSLAFSPFSIAITSLGEERTNISVFRTFVRCALVWFYLFPLPYHVWDGPRPMIVALPGLFSYLFGFDYWLSLSLFHSGDRISQRYSSMFIIVVSLGFNAVVQLLVFIYSGIQ